MTLTQLEYVLAVDKLRHFGKAAANCHVTQPTLSMQLQKLEDEIGVIIFDRSKSPVIPTIEGERVIAQARKALVESKRVLDVAKNANGRVQGSFKLGIIPTLSPYVIPLFAKQFSAKYPEVKLIIEELKTEDIVMLLDKEEIDAGIVVTPLHNKQFIEKVIYYESFYLFSSEDHGFYKKDKIDQNDLRIEDIWMLNKGNCFRDQVLNICTKSKKDLNENLQFESGSFETLKNMVLTTGGYTILPQMAVDSLYPDQLKNVKSFVDPVPSREVSIVYSRSFYKEGIVDAIHEEIVSGIPSSVCSLRAPNMKVIEIY